MKAERGSHLKVVDDYIDPERESLDNVEPPKFEWETPEIRTLHNDPARLNPSVPVCPDVAHVWVVATFCQTCGLVDGLEEPI